MALEVIGRGQKITVHRDPLWVPGRQQAVISLHDQHYEAGDGAYDKPVIESYSALTADAGGYTSGADQMRHALKVDDTGNRLWLPRRNVDSQSMRFGRPRYSLDPLGPTPNWTNLPLGAPSRQGGQVKWTRPLYEISAWITWRKIGLGWRILSNLGSDIVGLQIPVTLTGLQFDADTFQLKSAGLVLATVNVSDAVDATGRAFPVTRRINGGAVEYTMDLTGAVYPVTVTPLNDTLTTPQDNTIGYTTILSEAANNNYGARQNGFAGSTYGIGNAKTLLRFDLSSITAGRTCDSANLHVFRQTSSGGSRTLSVYPVASGNNGWPEGIQVGGTPGAGEDGCTWNYFNHNGSVAWAGSAGCSTANTDYENSALGSGTINGADALGTEYDISLTDTTRIAAMFGAGGTNYGFVAWINYAEYQYLCSDDHATAGYRPYLVVVHSAAAGATVVASRRSLLGVGV